MGLMGMKLCNQRTVQYTDYGVRCAVHPSIHKSNDPDDADYAGGDAVFKQDLQVQVDR